MLDRLTAADFEPLAGVGFTAAPPGRAQIELELVEVRTLRGPPAAQTGRRSFALLFRARTADHLPQGTVALAHDRLGRLDVFLVPVGRDADGLLLEAIFN